MKPIEIHIEGYKIVISKEDDVSDYIREAMKDKTVTYPVVPTCPNPQVTWTSEDVLTPKGADQ